MCRSRRLFCAFAFVWLASALSTACRREGAARAPAESNLPSASVVKVSRQNLTSSLKVAGQFEAYQEVDLHAKVSGYIRRINVDIGDRVRTGQVIATLEVPELNAQLAGTQAEVKHSQSEISRVRSEVLRAESNHAALHANFARLQQAGQQRPGLIAEQELDDARAKDQDAEAQVGAAQSAVAAAEQQLGVSRADELRAQVLSNYAVVTAPFSGVVTKRYADTGSLIQAGTSSNTQSMPLVRLVQSDVLRLRMPVPEADVRFIHEGGQVSVRVQATKQNFPATIVRFGRALDAATRTMVAEVDVPNPTLALSPGMFAEINIDLEKRDNALTVPAEAVVQSDSGSYVLLVDNGKVEKKGVSQGIQGPDKVEITSGLKDGDTVIVSGQTNYQTGELVRPKFTAISMPPEEGSK